MPRLLPVGVWRSLTPDLRAYLVFSLLSNVGAGVGMTIFFLYLSRLGLREDFLGLLSSITTITVAVGGVVVGPIINRVGAIAVIRVGVFLFAGSSLALALITEPAVLLLAGLANGVAVAALFIPNMPFLMERIAPERRTEVSSLAFGVQVISVTLGALMGGLLPEALVGWPLLAADEVERQRATLIIGALLSAVGIIPLLPIEARPSATAVVTAPRGLDDAANRAVARRDIAVFVAASALLSLGTAATQPFYNVYLAELGATTAQIGLLFSGSHLLAALLTLGGPVMARRVGLTTGLLLVRLAALPLFVPLLIGSSVLAGALAVLSRTISANAAWPLEASVVTRVVPERLRATTFGLHNAGWHVAWTVGSLVAGQVIVRFGYTPVFAWFIVTALAAALLFQGYFSRRLAAVERATTSEAVADAEPGRRILPMGASEHDQGAHATEG